MKIAQHVSVLYQSLPLPPNTKRIRLMEVHAASSPCEHDEPIVADLRVVDLEEMPSFSALSYVVGTDRVRIHSVTCGEVAVPITENCHTALKHLRRKLGSFTIWVDAVCISQTDTDEKSRQIILMGDIYSGARTVYIWLGEGNPKSDKALHFLATVGSWKYWALNNDLRPANTSTSASARSSWLTRHKFVGEWYLLVPKVTYDARFCLSTFLDSRKMSHMMKRAPSDCLFDVLTRQWTYRLWTYQEVLLSSNPVVVCGDFHLQWSEFARGIIFLEYSGLAYERRNGPMYSRLPALKAWTRIIFSRDRLALARLGTPLTSSTPIMENTLLTDLRDFYKLMYNVHYLLQYSWVTVMKIALAIACLSMLAMIVVVILGLGLLVRMSSTSPSAEANDIWDRIYKAYFPLTLATTIPNTIATLVYMLGQIITPPSSRIEPEPPTDDIIGEICSREVDDPKDKAFAVLSIFQKLLEKDLPVPAYERPLGAIYKEMSIQLIQSTGCIHLLLPASQYSMPGQPSWVPDWSRDFAKVWNAYHSQDFASFWTDHQPSYGHHHEFFGPDEVERPSRLYTNQGNRRKNTEHLWKWSSANENVLTVKGLELGSIVYCCRFTRTMDEYLEDETLAHLRNLNVLQNFFQLSRRTFLSKPWGLLALYGLSRVDNPRIPTTAVLKQWRSTLDLLLSRTAEEALSALKADTLIASGCPSERWKSKAAAWWIYCRSMFLPRLQNMSEILQTHVYACNSFAKFGGTFCLAKYSDEGRKHEFSHFHVVCGNAVRPGDKVVIISGISCPLLVRQQGSSKRLVSPVSMHAKETVYQSPWG